ncbi:hypothetical protein [Leptospira kanakyensis]|uniref:Uncharacterized protein n=1 Tax=Leptospira kanakyensis TaxID=2484968 RepID=A0A6N4QDZ8_9LEPT|nr:hypothetical protein [Leptospira kanakyensis]MCW7470761.1 hypothetical protein [Leptospira kanakyensis]MCW7483176.1 hypothetical protein [Leptospira kanakyensis]TGK54889.1 hypothetical protein EHQ11_01765 [Leptospira kanakyensis]TGK56391.1 hypothetical protein EHQ16_19115 [Leptospira kanakyensis]TGK75827.1 hypothetical protein EHQ18_01800 [Leptospira kanakyensis]
MKFVSFLFWSLVFTTLFLQCSGSQKADKILGESVISTNKPQSFKKIAPLTANSLGSRKNLLEHGWAVIPSGKNTVDLAYENFGISSRVAKAMVLVHMKKRSEDYPGKLGDTMKAVASWTRTGFGDASSRTEDIYDAGWQLSKAEWKVSRESFEEAGSRFVQGYVYLVPKVESDYKQMSAVLGEVSRKHSKDENKIKEVFGSTLQKNSNQIISAWSDSFAKASNEFTRNYEESGERGNSLLALIDIFQGYSVALKEVMISPVAKTGAGTGEILVVNGVYVPLSLSMNFSSKALISTGVVFYYSTKSGYRVFSPTLETGLFSSIGILSAASTVPTYTTGTTLAAFNQVTSVAGTTAVGVIGTAGGATYDTGAYATGMVYDFAKGTSEAGVYMMSSGLVLGYGAITVLPSQLLLTAVDGPILIIYDGPRVAIAVVRGNYSGFDDVPTGTVINLEEAKKAGKVKILTDDPKIIKKVLDAEIEEQSKRAKVKAFEKK